MSKKNDIYNGAMELFVEKGFAASVNELIERIGIAKGTLYHHITNKEQLIIDIYKQLMFEVEEQCVNVLNENQKENTKQVFSGIVKWFITNPSKFYYINIFESSPYMKLHFELVKDTKTGPRQFIMQKVNMGILKAYKTDMIAFFDFAFTRATANYFLSLPKPLQSFSQEFDAAFDMYWDGVAQKQSYTEKA
ncbi:TetR/AcrR family transcriptional regulator [Carboxylicivirga sp. M1479]|uniref:TetR/AcrR family transcriptional regulator n=1 Tax=Carboxylicivirga sp. M1479 TaxID=2594476 RepID=UPI0011773F51|nr:TetR/AcrR family transcriptional regulator [Carboxylicivirga sp. M1479]TRX70803.1 TetR/AcrR family transcriptional regulator [Carboxylicivirga sp. M1479]